MKRNNKHTLKCFPKIQKRNQFINERLYDGYKLVPQKLDCSLEEYEQTIGGAISIEDFKKEMDEFISNLDQENE